jgi:hypothetical protein
MIYVVGTDVNLPAEIRKEQRQKIVNNGLEYYARFNDKSVAQKYADKVKWATGINLTITEAYQSSIKL